MKPQLIRIGNFSKDLLDKYPHFLSEDDATFLEKAKETREDIIRITTKTGNTPNSEALMSMPLSQLSTLLPMETLSLTQNRAEIELQRWREEGIYNATYSAASSERRAGYLT